jgi:16S rRNA (adenine1518-N6/adenine1519-N6)-dimethyltransferase
MNKNKSKSKSLYWKDRKKPTDGPRKKKRYGQHFLKNQMVVDCMIDRVDHSSKNVVLEIGCGDGFLTRSILMQTKCKKLISYEIDPEWARLVKNQIDDPRLEVIIENILEINFAELKPHAPITILANLPYQITFPILFLIRQNLELFSEGVIMVQEEVAQKLASKGGRGYSKTSLFLQHLIDFKLLEKVKPSSFVPPPKVDSRLVYFKPKQEIAEISNEESFWIFLAKCFLSPRRTIRNNLKAACYDLTAFSDEVLDLRAQQVKFQEFINIWEKLNSREV